LGRLGEFGLEEWRKGTCDDFAEGVARRGVDRDIDAKGATEAGGILGVGLSDRFFEPGNPFRRDSS